ncbi:hypothetical protein POTOM_034764 [Populus tomentosa]|uniref:Auxin-responsive protein n=1 Tax=Populus tomentosa TaxID=118781 RepID=A0A8X7Z5Y0_POPTO|nr:hypothetical protein POTOM_034764 [Populus tomentosa]
MSHPSTELSLALYNPAKDSISNTRFEDIFVKLNYDPLETDPEAVCIHAQRHHHVLTYIDREGDWMMAGDVPWESLNVVLFTLILNVDVQDVLGLSEEIDDYKNIQCISGQLGSNSR